MTCFARRWKRGTPFSPRSPHFRSVPFCPFQPEPVHRMWQNNVFTRDSAPNCSKFCDFVLILFILLLQNTESLFSDNQLWPQQICWATKSENFIFWPQIWGSTGRVIMGICWTTQNICFLTTTRGHLPSPSYNWTLQFLSWRLAGQNTCSFAEIIHTSNPYSEDCPCCEGEGLGDKLANKYVRKILDTNWIMTALYYVNTTNIASYVLSRWVLREVQCRKE